jgi:hypothetical protein
LAEQCLWYALTAGCLRGKFLPPGASPTSP